MVPERTNRANPSNDVSQPTAPLVSALEPHDKSLIFGDDHVLHPFDDHVEGKMAPVAPDLHNTLFGVVLAQQFFFGDFEMFLQEGQFSQIRRYDGFEPSQILE